MRILLSYVSVMGESLLLWDVPWGRRIPTGRPIEWPIGRPAGIQAITTTVEIFRNVRAWTIY